MVVVALVAFVVTVEALEVAVVMVALFLRKH